MKRLLGQLLKDNDLPEPDEILDHDDGGIVCLWHMARVAVIVDPSSEEETDLNALIERATAPPVRDDREFKI